MNTAENAAEKSINHSNMEGFIFNIQPFSIDDGPGIRTTVFMKGCNLSCFWCHNPESLSPDMELQFFRNKCIGCGECALVCPNSSDDESARFTEFCSLCGACARECFSEAVLSTGYKIRIKELISILEKDKDIFSKSGGGVTFSGGEPFLQPAFLYEALKASSDSFINTAIESALCVPWESIEPALPYTDLVLCDIKTMDDKKHIEATGASNKIILHNIRKMSSSSVNMQLRIPVVPEFNDDVKSMDSIASFISKLPGRHPVELLPFHGLCTGKYTSLNMEYKAKHLVSPEKEIIKDLSDCFTKRGLEII